MCGGPLRAARAEEGNPRPGLSLLISGSASLLRLEASGLSRSGRAGGGRLDGDLSAGTRSLWES